MKNKINPKKMLESIVLALESNPEADRLKMCPECFKFHLVTHQGQDFCGPKCNNDYNNRKKKLGKFFEGGQVEELLSDGGEVKFQEINYSLPTYEELDELVVNLKKEIKSLKNLIPVNNKLDLDLQAAKNELSSFKLKNEELLKVNNELVNTNTKQLEILKEYEKNTVAGRKDTILSLLAKGPVKTNILRSLGAVVDDWHGTATLYGFNLRKVFFRDEYVIVAGQAN